MLFNKIPLFVSFSSNYFFKRVAKCDVTKIEICEIMGFVAIIRAIKTKNVSLLKISMLVQIVSEMLSQLYSNDSIQILLKMAWLFNVRKQVSLKRIRTGSSEHKRGNKISLIGGKMLNFGMQAFFILLLTNIIYNQISDFTNQIYLNLF